ncbi:MAG: YncE family protein [Gemmatimonadales bacterium]
MVRMTSRMAPALALLAALAIPTAASAQTFTVQKWDIKGIGGTDYLTAEPGTGRVFVSRSSHVMVVNGLTGEVLGDIPDTPGMHGIALASKEGFGFTTNGGDSTLSMFDLKDLHVIKKVHAGINRLDGIMYDDFSKSILSINHSTPGTAVVVDAKTGDVKGKVELSGNAPEGGVSDGKGKIYINIENKDAIDVVDAKTWTKIATWDIAPCSGPTGIAMDRKTNRIFAGCSGTSVVVDATTGKVVAEIKNGTGVDALGWDENEKLIYIPAGQGDGSVTVVHEDSPDKYTTVATVTTFKGAKTIAVDPVKHMAYLFQPEYGPAPAPDPNAPAPAAGRGGRGPRGPMVAGWFIAIKH